MNSYLHQKESVDALVRLPEFALFHETGMGKSKIVIDAACELYRRKTIDAVVIVAPASVRSVWAEEENGEIAKHASVRSAISIFGAGGHTDREKDSLQWIITNYEFIRIERRLKALKDELTNKRFSVILDESSFINNRTSKQAKACFELGKLASRRVILNGTPVMNSPLDLWAQFKFLDERLLGKYFQNYYVFRHRYCVMGGFQGRQVLKYVNLDDLAQKTSRYIHRKTKAECLDLPEKIHTWRDVPMSQTSWRIYTQMRKDMIADLDAGRLTVAVNVISKAMRLSQICGGFVGGVEGEDTPQELSTEKFDELVSLLDTAFTEDARRKAVVWFRFRAELDRALQKTKIQDVQVFTIRGGQTPNEREDQLRCWREADAAILLASTHAGGFGLTLAEADFVVYVSNDYSYGARKQSEDRTHRIGQRKTVTYVDLRATGPNGQKTIDHHVLRALAAKKNLSDITTDGWRKILGGEQDEQVDEVEGQFSEAAAF